MSSSIVHSSFFFFCLSLVGQSAAQTCTAGFINGPCTGGTCLTPGSTCIAAQGVCCAAGGVVGCVDLLNPSTGRSDCPSVTYLCNNAIYYSLMTTQCPATCGRCTGVVATTTTTTTTVAPTTCVDLLNPSTGVSDCPSSAYLCNNGVYYTLMTQQCPRTCGRCSG